MKLRYLGTAAAEGVPALLCSCENCRKARAVGGRANRTRSQALIDDSLLIDFPCDTLAHFQANSIDMMSITDCLVTHSHGDHLYPTDLHMLEPGFANVPESYHIRFHGSDKVGGTIKPIIAKELEPMGRADFHEVKAFDTFAAGKYTVTALPGLHDPKAGPLFYMITDGERTVLYAHDTHYFKDEVWEYFAKTKPHFDFVSLDCTNGLRPLTYVGHMSFAENKLVRERFLNEGYADENTIFVCNHFSHNGDGSFYDDLVPVAARFGFAVSHDGRLFEF